MSKSMITVSITAVVCISLIFSAGCESDAQTGALLGTAAGAGLGAIIGNQSGNAGAGALIGGAAGAGGGYLLGNESDKKKEKAQTQSEIDSLRAEQNTVTVWITNSNGSKIPVKLAKSGPNYVGPRGEIYSNMPTEDELRPVYGF